MALAHGLPLAGRLIFHLDLPHDRAGLLRKVHGATDDDHGFDAIGLQRGHVKKNVAAHADADGAAPLDAEMVQQSESV